MEHITIEACSNSTSCKMTITLPHKHAKLADEDKREIHPKFSFAKIKTKKVTKQSQERGVQHDKKEKRINSKQLT